jgi:hypothetical protein
MVVNLRAREISRDTRKLVRTPVLIIIKKKKSFYFSNMEQSYMIKILYYAYFKINF